MLIYILHMMLISLQDCKQLTARGGLCCVAMVVRFGSELRWRDRAPTNVPYKVSAQGGIRLGPTHNKVGFVLSIARLEGGVFDQPGFRLKYNPYLPTVPN